MSDGFPILDDDERSPSWNRKDTSVASPSGTGLTSIPISFQATEVTDLPYAKVLGDSQLAGSKALANGHATGTQDESGRRTPRNNARSRIAKCILLALVVLVLAVIVGTALPGPAGNFAREIVARWESALGGTDGSYTPSTSHGQTSSTAPPSLQFNLKSFLSNLEVGDCFTLTVSPELAELSSSDQNVIRKLDGQKVACGTPVADYRLSGTRDPSDAPATKPPFDGTSTIHFDDIEFLYELLPRDGRLLAVFHADDDSYVFYAYYLPDDYTLPPEATSVGFVEISTNLDGCAARDGRTAIVSHTQVCWTIVERR